MKITIFFNLLFIAWPLGEPFFFLFVPSFLYFRSITSLCWHLCLVLPRHPTVAGRVTDSDYG